MATERDETVAGPAPAAASDLLGDRLVLAEQFVALLATTGVERGLIGPREGPRLWNRHILNCAVVAELVPHRPERQAVIDVGSGAGLPGIVLAIARPDLDIQLVEPLARRTAWLAEAVHELGLTNVSVHTARAESLWGSTTAPWVTARAVTGIVQLAEWTLPLLTIPGQVLALKGSRGPAELEAGARALRRLGVTRGDVVLLGEGVIDEPTTVLRLAVDQPIDLRRFRARGTTSAGSARRRRDRPRTGGDGKVSKRGGSPGAHG